MFSYRSQLSLGALLLTTLFLLACAQNPPPATNSATGKAPVGTGPAVLEGFHDVTNCNGIMGWAWDKMRPEDPIKVDIYDGETLLTTVVAEDFRQDLMNAGIGNGRHSFNLPVPLRLKDGKPHLIRMKFAGTTTDLGSTPKEISCRFE